MTTPPLLLGVSLLFWGWQTGYWAAAIALALLYEGHRFVPFRWHFEKSDIRRISDFCTILFLGMFVYLLFSEQSVYFVLVLIQLIPLALFPLILAQAYSHEERIDIRALFVVMRKKMAEKDPGDEYRMNLTYPYLLLVVVAASAANQRSGSFYAGLIMLSLWGLWSIRSRRYPLVWWLAFIVMATAGGYAGHNGLHRFQIYLEAKGMEWFQGFGPDDGDPFQTRTAIGDIGALKPSSRILFRVTGNDSDNFPIRLRQAVYSTYRLSRWSVSQSGFFEISPGDVPGDWYLQPEGLSKGGKSIRILTRLSKGNGVLLLPKGAQSVTNLRVESVARNQFGTIKIVGPRGLLNYTVFYNPSDVIRNEPSQYDLTVSPREKSVMEALVAELKLFEIPPQKRLARIAHYFNDHFTYSLVLKKKSGSKSPLEEFLMTTRSGHCEYFATATVLLLRAAGIPARYVKGFSVHEYSERENRYIVRERHAHAWVLAYVDGAWHDVDNTPAVWAEMESAAESPWTWIGDMWSWFQFAWSLWWQSVREEGFFRRLWWLLIPLVFILARRLKGLRPAQRQKSDTAVFSGKANAPAGRDSAFYRISRELQQGQWHREPWEPLVDWLDRVTCNATAPERFHDLEPLLRLHCRYRFDPLGITDVEKEDFSKGVDSWLKSYRQREEKKVESTTSQ